MVEPLKTATLTARSWRLTALGTAAVVCCVLGARIALDGVQPYGADGAEYIEHSARLAVLQHVRGAVWTDPWRLLTGADASFPPLLHLSTIPFGALFGHGAGGAIATQIGWLLLLAVAVGVSASELVGRPQVGAPVAAATLLVPAFHGFATRYYYDLPMTALLWVAVALLLGPAKRAPVRVGLLAGATLAAAALMKWAAIAFAPPLVLGAALCGWSRLGRRDRGRRALSAVVALVVAAALCFAFLAGREGDNSFERMGFVAFTVGTTVDAAEGLGGVSISAVRGVSERVGRLGAVDLAFYPLRAATSVLSPPLLMLLLFGLVAWWRSGRVGLPLVVLAVFGHGAFLLGVMPVLDDRFVLPGLPTLIVAGGLGWATMRPRARTRLATAVLVCAALVGLDLHFGHRGPWNAEVEMMHPDRDDFPPTSARGLGVSSSVEGRGWARRDETPSRREPLRAAVWEAVQGCEARGVGALAERPLVGPEGDLEWVRYRALLDSSGGVDRVGGAVCGREGAWEHPGPLDVVLVAAAAGRPGCLVGDWRLARSVPDPEGGPGIDLWARGDRCGR